MKKHIPRNYSPPKRSARRKRRPKKTQPNIVTVLFLGIILAVLIGIAIRCSISGQMDSAVPDKAGSHSSDPIILPNSVSVHPLTVALGTTLTPTDFVVGLENSGLNVSYVTPPDFHIQGRQTVRLSFSNDTGSTTVDTELYLFNLIQEICVPVDRSEAINVRHFVPDPNIEAAFVGLSPAEIPKESSGIFDLIIRCHNSDYPVRYLVKESNPPTGVGIQVVSPIGTLPPAETLVADTHDQSDITISYLTQPDITLLGTQEVTVVLSDVFGNASEVSAAIEFIPAKDGPSFSGLDELHIQVGSTISYKSGVSVIDPEDGELTFTVDPGNVDTKTVGTYTAVYSAKDSSGNSITAHRTIVVQDEAAAAVEKYVQDVLSKIIKDDMTIDQQIYKIYSYTRSNIRFVGYSDKTSVIHSAYEGFSTGKGDCYTYYAMNKVLLDAMDIPNLEVRRIEGTSDHWWNLVLHEDNVYYHVDSCPKSIYLDTIRYYRMSDTDLDIYTYHDAVFAHRPNYYTYDKTLPEYQDITIAH